MVHMQPQEFEDIALDLARETSFCYISSRFVERIDAGEVRFTDGAEYRVGGTILTCGLYSSITHELLASICE